MITRPTSGTWYGLQPAWQILLETAARREHGIRLRLDIQPDHITYYLPIEVPGRRDSVITRIVFYQRPLYPCWGLPAEEYPRVYAAMGETSPHRMADDALCLYYPHSPGHERWKPLDGLLALIDLVRNHVFFEDYWRATGANYGGVWLGAEAPHGFPRIAA